MRVLACCFPLRSHLNTVFGLLAELRRRGHEVLLVAPEYKRSAYCVTVIEQLGISAVDLPTRADGTVASVVPTANAWAAIIRDPTLQLQRYEGGFSVLAAATPKLCEIMAEWRPDVVATDPGFFPAAAAADSLRIPWASIQTCLSISVPADIPSLRLSGEALTKPIRDRVFASLGVPSPPAQYMQLLSPHVNIVWHKSALVGEPRFERVHLVGPTMTRPIDPTMVPLALDRVPSDRPVAYITFGGMANEDPDVYRRALAACDELGVYPLVSCPEAVRDELGPGDRTHTMDQLAALERADVVIGYVGAVTLMESMFYGKPLVTLPLHSDHPLQAWAIARADVGRSISYHSTPAEIAQALAPVLDPGNGYASRARVVSAAYRDGDADSAAATLIEQA